MITLFATLISYIFNPILLFVFVPFFLLARSNTPLSLSLFWTGYTIVFLVAMTLFLYYAVRKKIFTDMDVSHREQRPLLFLVSFIMGFFYIAGVFILKGPHLFIEIAFGVMFGVLVDSYINRHIKASIHVATVSALIFALAIAYSGAYLLLLLLIPLVAWSRVRIKRHTPQETIVGGLLGILLSLSVYLLNFALYH